MRTSKRTALCRRGRCTDSVGRSDFCEPAVNLLLEGSDFFHRTFFGSHSSDLGLQHTTLTSAGLPRVRESRRRSFEEIIGKVILDEWGSRAIGTSSWRAPATAGAIKVNTNETN